MRQLKKTGLMCWVLWLLQGCAVPSANLPAESAPLIAVQHFLDRVDSGDDSGAWALLDGHSQQLEDRSHWQKGLSAVHEAYGPLLQREPGVLTARSSYFRHPDGTYVIASFRSRYTAKAAAVETVVVRLEPNGAVSVIAYVIN